MQGNISVKRITAVNSYELSPSFSLETHTHDEYELFFVDSGSMSYYYEDGRQYPLKSGELLLHSPHTPHGTFCDGKHSATFFNILFKSNSSALDGFTGRSITLPKALYPLVRAMISEAESVYNFSVQPLSRRSDAPHGAELLVIKYLELLFIHLGRGMIDGDKTKGRDVDGKRLPTDEIYRFLADSIYTRLTLDDVCERFHFGKTHISVAFKKKFGVSVVDCFLDMKISEAKRLLREENMTVREVSERLCFESPEYFSRCFKKRVGYTPRAYRGMLITGKIAKKQKENN